MITIEARFKDVSSTMSLLLPHRSIAVAMERLSSGHYGDDADGAAPDVAAAEVMRASLGEVEVEIRAEVAAVELPIDDVVSLKPGDVIRFKTPRRVRRDALRRQGRDPPRASPAGARTRAPCPCSSTWSCDQ